ncbi:Transcriptional regulator, MarR family (plasmid) [Metabacillus dongyingensis]|nr:Transcriptional regulator, MarR family [Metabacillus dongyingensis]
MGLINRKQEWKTKYLSLTEVGKEFFYEVVSKQEQFQASQFPSGKGKNTHKVVYTIIDKLAMLFKVIV